MTPLDLLGTWDLVRVVDDHRNGERRDVRGTVTLTPEPDGRVRWDEEGTMSWDGHAVPVSRTLYAVPAPDGSWAVEFSDGRPFHRWAVGERVTHPCSPDTYVGLVTADDPTPADPGTVERRVVQRWTVEWRATGPEKDYVMHTIHSGRRPATRDSA
ncbi:DUF6314 family protein [Nocardioides hungaricus]